MRGGGEGVEGLLKCWKVAHVLRGQIGCHCSRSHRTVHGMLRKMRVFKVSSSPCTSHHPAHFFEPPTIIDHTMHIQHS